MKNLLETIGLMLAGVAAAVGGVLALVYGESWKAYAGGGGAALVGAAMALGMLCVIIREARAGTLITAPKYFKHEQAMEGAEEEAKLLFPLLLERFRRLAEKDDLTCVEADFLSWQNASTCGIRIYAAGGDAWCAACDLNTFTTLQRKDVSALCRRHKVKIAGKGAVFNAVAFYRNGKLTIYPRQAAKLVHEAMMAPSLGSGILSTSAAFDQWLHDCTEEG